MPGGSKQRELLLGGKLKIKLSLTFLIFLIYLMFPSKSLAQATTCQIIIHPQQVQLNSPFGVFIKISGLELNKNYQYGLWVYGGKPLSSIWNGTTFASAYTYIDIPPTLIENGIYQEWVILKINSLPSPDYDYYLKLRVREKNASGYLCEDIKYSSEDNFNILDDSSPNKGIVCGQALNEDGEPFEGGMAVVLGENLEFLSIGPCGVEGEFSLPLIWGEDYYLQIYDNQALPLTRIIKFSLNEACKNFENLFLGPPSPALEIDNIEVFNINSDSLDITWRTTSDYFMAKVLVFDGENIVFSKSLKANSISIENLQPHTEYKIVLIIFNNDFVASEKEIWVSTFPKVYPEGIFINEIFPRPQDNLDDEFIELFNSNNFEVDISFWKIKDGSGATREYTFPENTKIGPLGFLVLRREESGIILNDDSDFVMLLSPDDYIKDKSPPYYDALSGFSFSRFSSDWQWTSKVTPLAVNIFESPKDKNVDSKILVLPINEIKKLKKGVFVGIEGFVTVLPNVLGKQIFYIQDESGGIQIYFKEGVFPSLSLGQKVRVFGELGEAYGEQRLIVKNFQDIQILPQIIFSSYLSVPIGRISDDLVGRLLKVSGKIVQTSGSVFYISDGSGILKVYIKPTTNIKKPKMKKEMEVVIFGLLSKTTSGYRLLPCYQKDIVVKEVEEKQEGVGSENNSLDDDSVVKAASLSDELSNLPTVPLQTKKELHFLEILGWVLLLGGFAGIVLVKFKKIKN